MGRVRRQQDMLGHTAYTKGLVEHKAILSIGKGAARVLPDNRTWALGHMLGHTAYTKAHARAHSVTALRHLLGYTSYTMGLVR